MRKSWLLVLLILTLCACTVLFAACAYDDTTDNGQGVSGGGNGNKKPERTEFTVVIDDGQTVTTVNGKIGDTVTATAANLSNKLFLGWRYDGNVVSTDGTYQFEIVGDGALNAVYCNAHTIYLDAGEGEVAESGVTVGEKQRYTLPVPTLKNYEFLGWYDGDTAYTDNQGEGNGEFSLFEDIYLSAKWQKIPQYSIKVNNGAVDDRGNDERTSETQTVFRGDSVTLTAKDVENMKFIGWLNADGKTVSELKSYSFTAVADAEYTAHYKSSYNIIAINGYGGGEVEYLTEVTVYAQTNIRGKKFICWRNLATGEVWEDKEILDADGEKIGAVKNNGDGSMTFNATVSVVLEAVYEKIEYKVEYFIDGRLLSAEADYVLNETDPEKKQALIDYYSRFDEKSYYNEAPKLPSYSVDDDPYYEGNTDDLAFYGWTDAPDKMPAENAQINGLVAKARYNIKVVNGFGSGTYESGTVVEFTPKDLNGKRFVGWTTSDGTPITEGVDENDKLTVTVRENATYVAKFEDVTAS